MVLVFVIIILSDSLNLDADQGIVLYGTKVVYFPVLSALIRKQISVFKRAVLFVSFEKG